MKNYYPTFLFIFICSIASAQELFVTNGGPEVSVQTDDFTLYTNYDLLNQGTITLNDASRFVFDGDFTNTNTPSSSFNYNNGVLVIGSGNASSANPQSINFKTSETINFIELNKQSNLATIDNGLMRLLETLTSDSGTLDANSNIDGTTRVEDRGLVFASDATNTAVIDNSSGGSVQNVIIERYIPESNRAFRALSSSVNTNASINENLQEGAQITTLGTTVDPRTNYGTHITGSTTGSNGFDATQTGNPSMYQYTDPNSDAYTTVPNTNSKTMAAGESFFMLIRGDRSFALTANDIVQNDTRLRMLGDAQIGDITIDNALGFQDMPTTSGAFASVGNPYQAQVNLESVLSSASTTGVDETQVYVFDPTVSGGASSTDGIWVTLNFDASGNFTSAVPESGSTSADKWLQPNQAFYIESTSATAPQVRFEESFKRSTNPTQTVGIFSEDTPVTDLKISMNLYEDDGNNLRDGILLQFSDNYTDAFIQEEDAISFSNFAETMATVSEDGNQLSFDKRNIDEDGEIVQLAITNYVYSNYRFDITLDNTGNEEFYLVDNYLETETLIDSDTFSHSFSVDPNIPASTDVNRFQLGINNTTLGNTDFALNGLSVYPNPVVNTAIVNLAEFTGQVNSVKVYDVTGKMIQSQEVSNASNELEVDMSSLSSGIYILQLNTDSGQFQQKIIKE